MLSVGCSSPGQAAVSPAPSATVAASPAPENLGLVKRSSSAIALSKDGRTLLVVNPDSNSASIVDLGAPPAVTEISVGADPRTVAISDDGARGYTANRAGDSVSVIDLAGREAIAEIPVGARPYGLILSPDSMRLYVAEQGFDRLNVLDTRSLSSIATMSLADRPSGLAISEDGAHLYVTHLLKNAVTRIDMTELAEPETIPLWPDSNLVQSVVLSPDGAHVYVPHTRANSGNQALTLDTTVFPIVSVIDHASGRHLVGGQFNLEILDPPAVGLPFDAAFTPDGRQMWVVNAASNDITVIDLESRQRAAHIEVEDNPRGIVISPDGSTAYVNNALAGSVSIIDTVTYAVTQTLPVTAIPMDSVLLSGKRLFHSSDDPRMGKDQWMSCNTCHFDGEIDGQTWLLGFAGPRNTTSLLGMAGTLPLRWSGEWDETADSEFAIRMDSFGLGLAEGEMRCSFDPVDCFSHPPHAGVSGDLDALAAYINSLDVPLSPYLATGGELSEAALRGQAIFHRPAVGCAACHTPRLYTDNLIHDVGTATEDELVGPAFNTPSLLGIYDTAPYFHNGSTDTLYAALTRPTEGGEHNVGQRLTAAEIEDLIAFLLSLPFEE